MKFSKFTFISLLFLCMLIAVPAAMAVGNETANTTINSSEKKHGESGEVNPVTLAKLLSDGVINEDDYNRMIATVVENEQAKQQQIENTTTPTPDQTVTPTAEPTQAATPEPTEESIPEEQTQETPEAETLPESEPAEVQAMQVLETVSEVQDTATETKTTSEPAETVTVEKGLIEQIIAALQGLLGV
ncbi:hypothetical protein [Methanochimaera problematica]|uniref:hypothetical protein n=1 Tax=Methanochimaera problematica TaxID=2609417 RepID=UPI002938F1C2|nr:hypothetical protein [Methanoplanus sp. FWC-SCC4]